MHQSMQSGSMARAAMALPMSAVSQPNCSRTDVTVFFASASLPQMNIVGLPPLKLRIDHQIAADRIERLDELAHRRTRAAGAPSATRRGSVKNLITPSVGGASAMGLVASMTTFGRLPARPRKPPERHRP